MGRGRYGDTNDGQDTGSEPSSQPESSSSETIETQQTSEEPTPTTSPTTQTSENISDVIMENTDPDRGFLTSSGTYVNIYKNAGNNERTYTSDNTVKPAGERIDPRSNEGQIIQQQYADQADRRVDNLAQSERFWAIREGQGSVKDLLYDSQSAEQRRLTDIFFEERNLDPGLPENHEMFSHVIKDVKGLIQKIPVPSNGKELQSLKKQVFDFGTQWVYYLDWKLYMSKELY